MALKRRNGEGSYDRIEKNGIMYYRWRGIIGIDPASGKPIRKNLYARTSKELTEKVKALLADPGPKTTNRITVKQWLHQWLAECCGDVKPKTLQAYQSAVDVSIAPKIGGIRLTDLQPIQLQRYINDLKRSGLSGKSIRNYVGVLHRALQVAVLWGYIPRNPADNLTLPRIEKKEVDFLAGDDLRAFLEACEDNPYAPMMKLAVFTGMREGEILGLTWDAVDFEHGTISVKQQLQLIGGNYVMQSTKSDRVRIITPAPFVFDLLRTVRRDQLELRLRMGSDWLSDYDLVFTRYDGKNVARNTLYMNFKRCLASAGLPSTTRFHDLRHSYAVFALESGDNIKEVQAALGHYSAAFTLNTYEHVSKEAKIESAARQQAAIEDLLRDNHAGSV